MNVPLVITVMLVMTFRVHHCQLTDLQKWLTNLLNPSSSSSSSSSSSTKNTSCPHGCSCTRMTLGTLVDNYIDLVVPQLGGHIRPNISAEAKELLTRNFIAALLVNYTYLTEIKCRRNETFSLQRILEESPTRGMALDLTCADNATLVWDSTGPPPPTYSIKISNCFIRAASPIKIPSTTWIVNFDRINASAANKMDFSAAWMLIALSVTNSSITHVPEIWRRYYIPKLVFINLEGNSLTDYNCSIKILPMVDTINLNNNALTRIPHCIANDKDLNLSHLSLAGNAIDNISELFQDETNHSMKVKFLNFHNNKITELGVFHKSMISSLDLSWNNIKTLHEGVFDNLQLLKWIDLSHNHISYLSRGPFKQQYFLQHINLSHNQLTEVTFDQGPVSIHIVDMDLTYNRLPYPPFYDTGYISPRLTKITIANNPFVCDCNMDSFYQFMTELNRTAYLNFVALTDVLGSYEMDNSLVQPYTDIDSAKCYEPRRERSTLVLSMNMTVKCPVVVGCPQSCTCYNNKRNHQLIGNCSYTYMDSLPLNFPSGEKMSFFVSIFNNSAGLKTFDYRSYLPSISELYATNASIERITAAAVTAMQNIRVLHLHANLLSELPPVIRNITFKNLQSLTLHGNPWQCNCNTSWFPKWVRDNKQVIESYDEVTCTMATGISKSIDAISSADFDCDEESYLPLVIGFSILIVVTTLSAGIVYKYRLEVRVLLYTRFNWRPFDNFRLKDEEKQFDAFVSYSEKDYQWVVHTLVNELEAPKLHRKLCVHYRDFPVGAPVVENILWAIGSSRCTLLLLTNDFLQSEWCMYEFREAHRSLLESKDNKLIIVLKGDVDRREVDEDLRAYLRTHTYLDVRDKWFWSKLDYVLPAGPIKEDVEQRV
ncbi:protein toll-like [Gigantopelta aegis]|uniref:protein toll-like n=1 Tax=Gigantopelta aegis TaxID=1735272 RepID=UPI001B88E4CC|nr:protein toll-like [Gigantopelta aegis]